MKNLSSTLAAAVVATGLALAGSAHASLILVGQQDFQGTGLGTVNTIITVTSPGSTSTETGQVSVAPGGGDNISGSQVMTGNSQTQTRSLSQVGITTASELRLVFNASEPGINSGLNGIMINDLQLNIFTPTGVLLFNSGFFTPIFFPTTLSGIGNSGFVFRLDDAQAAQAQAAAFGSLANRIGVSLTATMAEGGLDTVFAGVVRGPGTSVPEPVSLALFGAGLLGLGLARRRKAAPTA